MAAATTLTLVFASVAVADTLNTNELSTTDNLTYGGGAQTASATLPTAVGTTTSFAVSYTLQAQGGDGGPQGSGGQCNVSAASPGTLSFTGLPAGVSATSGTSWTTCGTQDVVFTVTTAAAAGTYSPITPSMSGGVGTFTMHEHADFVLELSGPAAPSDTTAPTVSSIDRAGAENPTNDASVSWTVTFSESVTGVDATDFSLAATGVTGAAITNVSGSGSSYTVTASTGSGSGSLGLSLVDNDSIADGAGNKLGGIGAANGNFTGQVYTIDKAAPGITLSTDDSANATTGWFNIASDTGNDGINLTATATDGSGVASLTCTNNSTAFISQLSATNASPLSGSGLLGAGVNNISCIATDGLGNSTAAANATTGMFSVDLTAPTVSLIDGPADGASYYFSFVPAAPTCTASDASPGSGLNGTCAINGYGTTVGSHTVTASVSDNAGNSSSDSATYAVLAWTINGFYRPVDMGIVNYAKAGSTVPLKFEVFAGPTELTDTAIVSTFTQKINCASGDGDAIEEYATGSTSLRYDTTAGQFVFNWKTPTTKACYRVTMTTLDGSSISADFQTR